MNGQEGRSQGSKTDAQHPGGLPPDGGMSNIGNRLLRGSAARLASDGVTMAVALFLMPVVIETLGDRYYGIWALSASFLGFYGLFDLGISNAVARFVSRALGKNDQEELLSFFSTSVYLLIALGGVVFLFSAALALLGHRFVHDPDDARLFKWLILILGTSVSIQFPTRAFHGILKSHLRYDMLSGLEIAVALLRVPLILLVLRAGYSLLGMAVVSAALALVLEAAKVWLAFRVHPGLDIRPRAVSVERAKTLVGYGAHVLIATVADMLRFRTTPFVITVFRNVSLVTPFAVATRLTDILSQFSLSLVGVLTPMFSRLEGMGQWGRIRTGYILACRIATYISMLFGGLLVILGGMFVQRWLGPKYANVIPLLWVLTVGTVFTCVQIPGMSVLYGTSRHKFYSMSNVIHGLLTLGTTALLIGPYGLMGVALGVTIPSLLVKFLLQPLYVCRVLKIPVGEWYLRHVLYDFMVPLAYLGIVRLAAWPFLAPAYTNVFLVAIVSSVMFVPYALAVGLTAQQRRLVLHSMALGRLAVSR